MLQIGHQPVRLARCEGATLGDLRQNPGGLPIDISKDGERFLNPGEKKQKLPREYKDGFATAVLVLTKQAEWVSVLTDKPVLALPDNVT